MLFMKIDTNCCVCHKRIIFVELHSAVRHAVGYSCNIHLSFLHLFNSQSFTNLLNNLQIFTNTYPYPKTSPCQARQLEHQINVEEHRK